MASQTHRHTAFQNGDICQTLLWQCETLTFEDYVELLRP